VIDCRPSRFATYAVMPVIVVAFSFSHCSIAAAQQRETYAEYKFDKLDVETRQALEKFNLELSKFSEGCSEEQSKKTDALLKRISADAVCAINILKKDVPTATLTCGIAVPLAVSEHRKAKAKLKDCKEMNDLLEKYKQNCEGKEQLVLVYKDALYCYSVKEDRFTLTIDFKNKTATVSAKDAAKK
jgi:hypothetical protein